MFFLLNKLTINLDKTNHMVVRPHNLNIDTSYLYISLHYHKIQNVKFTKFIGVTIDKHLSCIISIMLMISF